MIFSNEFKKNIIVVSGITRAGKSALCPLISSFNKCEMFFTSPLAENIVYLLTLKKITPEYAKFLLHLIFNEQTYNLIIGRNINLRTSDYTSVKKHRLFKTYIKRSREKSLEQSYETTKFDSLKFPIMFHDAMLQGKFLLKNFSGLKIIDLVRHPVDLIYSWHQKGYYGKIYHNKKNVLLTYKYKNKLIPFYAFFSKKKFLKTKNNYEKIILMIEDLFKINKKEFNSLNKNEKKRVMQLSFDDVINVEKKSLKKLTNFLKTKKTSSSKKIIKSFRKNHLKERNNKLGKILRSISPFYKKKLLIILKDYESKF